MKAIAKHDCQVTLTLDLNSISLNRVEIKKGQELDMPVHEDQVITTTLMRQHLGKRSVIFNNEGWLVITYERDFDYVD